MSSPRQRLPSLRLWLQSTSLLAVVAGYSLLLLINQRLADWRRLQDFRQNSDQVLSALGRKASSTAALNTLLLEARLAGLNLALAPVGTTRQPSGISMESDRGFHWLEGTVPLDMVDGSRVFLRIRQDVTDSVRQERLSFWLLVVAAGSSSLFTSALLRLVLKRGLVQPLEDFTAQLQTMELHPREGASTGLAPQAQELQPIAEAFKAMQQRLWASWERQRLFTDSVAHELRTPITLISGHAQSLLRQGAPMALTPSLQLIRSEAERMSSLVSDLLDLARQDAQRLNLQRQAIQADDTLLQLYERLTFKAAGRLRLDPGPEGAPEPPVALGDPDRLQQCLTALVDNALSFSPAGTAITLASSTGPDGCLVLHVRDQGPGVAEEERARIFARFVRGSAATAAESRGSGIGLAVVNLLMTAMGGKVEVYDGPGGGADFQLHLQPLRASGRQV